MRAAPALALLLALAPPVAQAAPAAAPAIEWRVYNPFRFFRHDSDFLRHRDAYFAILAANGGKAPANAIEQAENRLNGPNCANETDPDTCAATWRGDFAKDRLGWAAKSLGEEATCYARAADGAYRYLATCNRDSGAGEGRTEDYVAPTLHSVEVRLSAAMRAAHASDLCRWRYAPAHGAPGTARAERCAGAHIIEDVGAEGGTIEALAIDGKVIGREPIVVKDWLVLGLGDSFASGEGNPDRPVTLAQFPNAAFYGGMDEGLPIRATPKTLKFDDAGNIQPFAARDDYYAARAGWTSPDCHRSQYSYQFRVALQLAVENPHRAVTLIHLACSGADALDGVFRPMPAREFNTTPHGGMVNGQFDAALDLLCAARVAATYPFALPAPVLWGSGAIAPQAGSIAKCAKLKRPVDLALLSLGGNDVGFSGLVAYAITASDSDIAPIADLKKFLGGAPIRFQPVWAYLPMLRTRLQATAGALAALLGTASASVVQTDYENPVVDENGATCADATGLDAVSKLAFDKGRADEVVAFAEGDKKRGAPGLFDTLRCSANPAGCGPGWSKPTGFRFVDTQPPFAKRGICAMKDARERTNAAAPRLGADFSGFGPYQPENFLPYQTRRRLFVSVNDAFLKANTQIDYPYCPPFSSFCPPVRDRIQAVSSGLYGGAFHRSAEAHAIVADQAMNQAVRAMFAGR